MIDFYESYKQGMIYKGKENEILSKDEWLRAVDKANNWGLFDFEKENNEEIK